MELVSHIANATFSSLIRTFELSKSLKNTAFKQKTFRIVKERTMRSGIARSLEPSVGRTLFRSNSRARVIARHRGVTEAGNDQYAGEWWWSQSGSNR